MPNILPVKEYLSPNYEVRLTDTEIKFLIIHYTACDFTTALQILTDPHRENRVSAHYLIDDDGTIVNLVPEDQTAWHAGNSSWRHYERLNPWSIGIELVNPGHEYGYRPFDQRQMHALIKLCQQILKRHSIPAEFVLGHADIAPQRKIDPGELFNWSWLAHEGIGMFPHIFEPSSRIEVDHVQSLLARWGYAVPVNGEMNTTTQAVIRSFQMHYCPDRVDCTIYPEMVGKLEALCHHQQWKVTAP